MSKAGSSNSSQPHRTGPSSRAEFSASGNYRRRGPKNRFVTQASRESEVDGIIALMVSGMKVAKIAEAMKISIPTIYRRIDSIKNYVRDVTVSDRAAQEARASQLLALFHADIARAHTIAEQHLERRTIGPTCCPQCRSMTLELEAIRVAAKIHKAELNYLKHMGFFDVIKMSGRAVEVLRKNQPSPPPLQ